MQAMREILLTATLMAVTVTAAFAQEAAPTEAKVLAEGAGIKFRHVDGMHSVANFLLYSLPTLSRPNRLSVVAFDWVRVRLDY